MRLLGHAGLRRILANHRAGGSGITLELDGEDADDSEDWYGVPVTRRRRRTKSRKNTYPPVPSEQGKILMDEGKFGSNNYYRDKRVGRKTRLARKLVSRELGTDRDDMRVASTVSQV